MLIYVCESTNQLPKCLDYNASVRLSNGRPIFKSLWVSARIKKLLKGVKILHMHEAVKPRLTFWTKGTVAKLCPEFIFRVPAEYQKESCRQDLDKDEESSV